VSPIPKVTLALALAGALSAAGVAPALAATGSAGPSTRAGTTVRPAILRPAVDPGTVITTVQKIYGIYKSFLGGGNSAQVATQQIIDAINQSRDAVISQIDAVAAADVKACAQSAVINFADFNALNPTNQQAFALDATSCVTRADSLISAVSDKAAKDQLGFAVNTVGPIALIARARTGLTNGGLTSVLKEANQTVLNQLIPTCDQFYVTEPGAPGQYQIYCTAYNGDKGATGTRRDDQVNAATARARDSAAYRISWLLAEKVLPLLA
jgi:hypothetical protein